jgi:uncharacterized OsmC-like protein
MTTIADTILRLEDAVVRRPGFGSVTCRSRTTLGEGLRCVSVEGDWTIETDLPVALGGSSSAPTPSDLLRAALGACMAMTYRLRAERAGLGPFTVTVDVEADSQLAGMLLTTSVAPPGFTGIRYHVEVECDAPPDDIRRVLDEGDRLSPMLDAIGRATAVSRSATIRPVGG